MQKKEREKEKTRCNYNYIKIYILESDDCKDAKNTSHYHN